MRDRVELHDKVFKPLITAEQIATQTARVAEALNKKFGDYSDKESPIILGVMNGAFMFLSDLARNLSFHSEISFIKISSYEGTQSSGSVKELIGVTDDIAGRDVIIVEDIVDTGRSITHLCEMLRHKGVKSITVCTLFFKPGAYKGIEVIDLAAFEIGNEFIVGYGLDYNQLGRELPDVYIVTE